MRQPHDHPRGRSPSQFRNRAVVRAWMLVALGLLLATGSGCSLTSKPKFRMGSLPYPGRLTLFTVGDPDDLGEHRYDSFLPLFDKEKSRGIIYTCRGGFLDISHVRHTADWTRYYALRVREAIAEGEPEVSMAATDSATIVARLDYSASWLDLPTAEREVLANELALRVGQQAAYALSTYHESITWWGYGVLPIYAETKSAFTYDDMISHAVGLRIAARAMADGGHPGIDDSAYNDAATAALAAELKLLGAMEPEQTRQAVEAVKGWWWGSGTSLKRQTDAGYASGYVTPWLIPGFRCGRCDGCTEGAPAPLAMALPALQNVLGHDLTGAAELYIKPGFFQRQQLREFMAGDVRRLSIDGDLPVLVEQAAAQIRRQLGPDAEGIEPVSEEIVSRLAQMVPDASDGVATRQAVRVTVAIDEDGPGSEPFDPNVPDPRQVLPANGGPPTLLGDSPDDDGPETMPEQASASGTSGYLRTRVLRANEIGSVHWTRSTDRPVGQPGETQ